MLLANIVDLLPPMKGRDHTCAASQSVDEP